MTPPRSRRRDIGRGVFALLALGALLIGAPLALARFGWPLPRRVPSLAEVRTALTTPSLTDEVLTNIMALVCWAAWLVLSISVAMEGLAWWRGAAVPRLAVAGPLQPLATRLVAAVILALPSSPRLGSTTSRVALHAVTTTSPAGADTARGMTPAEGPAAAATRTISTAREQPSDTGTPSARAFPARDARPDYVVENGDSLWTIAQRSLGDPRRFTEIWKLNAGRQQGAGTFRDPNRIYRGWRLTLPLEERSPAGAPAPPLAEPARSERTEADLQQPDRMASAGAEMPFPKPSPTVPPNDEPAREPTPPTSTATAHGPGGLQSSPTASPEPSGPPPWSSALSCEPTIPGTTHMVAASPDASPSTVAGPTEPPSAERTRPSVTPPQTSPPPPPSGDPDDPRHHATERPQERSRHRHPGAIDLGSGSVVGISLASGITAALALGRLRRRRRRVPCAPQTGISYGDPPVGDATRRLMTAAAKGHDADSSTGHSSGAGTALSIAARDGDEVLIDLASISGLHLTGAGRDGVCRALLTAFLAAGGPDAAQVSVADDVYDAVTNRADPFPGLERVATLHELLSQAEVELVRRARLFATEDVDDLAAHRRAHPDEVLPARLLVVGDVPASQVERFRAILTVGGRLGLLGVIVGDPAGDFPAVEVDSSGVPLSASPDRLWETLHGTRLYTIGPEQATELLGILADARHDRESPSPVVVTEPFDVKPSPAAPIHVALFGPYRISAEGNELRTGLRSKARELLAFFLLHPEGATLEAAVEALWPEADPGRGPEWFWSALGNLRTRLRSATGQTDLKVIDRIGQIYQVDTSLFDVDLWRFQAAVGAAEEASDPKRVADALTRASEEYQGDFLDSAYFEWADAPREDLRRRAVDVAATLAELQIGAGEFEAAVRALERATAIDPYAEDLYRRLMRLQAQLGRIHAVRHTFARLESRLAELDVDPEPATLDLRDEILRAHSRLPSTEAV